MQLTRHEILSTKARGSRSPAFPPPQHRCSGGRLQQAGLHSSILAKCLTAHLCQMQRVGEHTAAELTPLCTSKIQQGSANDEEFSFQHQMSGFLGALHCLSDLLCSVISHTSVLSQPGWDGPWSFSSSFPTCLLPACQ